ncbi:biopolymer transporter ExbD [Prosthecochloris sp. N2]|uniref:ExbD/TolR family protein n=1 Tax=Prosthecochloris ethylica TaxID=2743976 RepID=UPI0018831DC2|nr:biopolymer transporter ExbD [Prosthecochloris ethylica]MBF0587463.1 biopolymer transporter ExbD [Prosthecochloris ethylica]
MGLVDSPDRKSGRRGKRERKRLGFHIDMTPMVDVAFLLLTFFMLTTTFGLQNTMEINIPPESGEVKIAEDNVMTLRIGPDGNAYWSIGSSAPQTVSLYDGEAGKAVSLSDELRGLLVSETRRNSKLVIVVKLSGGAKYRNLVDLIDEFNLLQINRFSLDEFTEADAEAIGVAARENGREKGRGHES